ncbi:MAG TPA: MmgE/PrpD family protein [Actinocrinis sp.]|uniref:MmgE/PrpD family protein n=1 Tax=Actinocrinis sp. TaxID=1920516 RepID=UPI002DDD6CDE|nr:MmgE/PrpD family protein [Actinocrinis sp.]HEV2343178.1 MmgE/PrpD family protein [Actinocrinis sp.]
MSTLVEELAEWAAELRPEDVPDRVLDLAASQVLSQLAAIRAGWTHPLGRKLVRAFGTPSQPESRRAAAVLAGLGSWLNLDDTAYAGHLSNSTVTVPLAYAPALGLNGEALLTAIVAANECAARITAASTLGPFRGQTAVQTSLVGAAAGRLHCEGAPAQRWVDAIGLALAAPPWTLFRGYIGSDARALGAFGPVQTAMDACDAAAAGMVGAADILEHPDGFLARFATVPLPETVVAGFGERWHTDTFSFKVRPGGPGIDAAVDCAIEMAAELPGLLASEVEDILVEASLYTEYVGRVANGYVTGPDAPTSALPLSIPYTVATALLTGGLTVADFAAPAVDDPERWELAKRVRLTQDEEMTRDLFVSEAPFGEALREAGDRAKNWVRGFGGDRAVELLGTPDPPRKDFLEATKHTGARVTVRLTDGRSIVRRRDIPIGAIGPQTRARHRELVREKYLAVGGPPEVADGCAALREATPRRLAALLKTALKTP